MENTEELKPCPFCGKEAFLFDGNIEGRKIYRVICKNNYCCMQGKIYLNEKEAIKAWNRRIDNGDN